MNSRFGTTKDACDLCRVGRVALYKWERKYADFPRPKRIGRNLRFDLDALTAWLANNADAELADK